MKKTILRHGLYAALVLLVIGLFNLFVLAEFADYSVQEVAGYLTILISMIFVFLGIRHFRNEVNNGLLRFTEGLKVGLLITVIPSIAFGLFDLLYTRIINPGWHDDYYSKAIQKMQLSVSADKLPAELKKLQDQKELFSNPFMEFLLMAATVFIIGMVVSIISSLTLRRSRQFA